MGAKIEMELNCVIVEPDFSVPEQKELYLSHPYDRNFMGQMDLLLEKKELPRFVTLAWFTWWFLHQERYERVEAVNIDEYGQCRVVLETGFLTLFYDEDISEYCTSYIIPIQKCNYKELCAQLGINEGEPHTPWFYSDKGKDFICQQWLPQLTNENVQIRIRGWEEDFPNSADLFLEDEGVCQIFVSQGAGSPEWRQAFCRAHNDLNKNLYKLDLRKWYHEEGDPYHYFITEIGPLELSYIQEELHLEFKVKFVAVLDWARHHFLDHHLDRITAYSNPSWNLQELQEYAKETWDVNGTDRIEILKEIKERIECGTEWVSNLTHENLQ